jgi:bifunctional UDP-N-acetylglucosamine pyrophosphorylase/glucosamine-1-phosphate N-acetyltransferase
MERGVGIRDPKSTFIDSDVQIGQDTLLLPHTIIEEGSRIGERCVIGPFARIRGASRIGSQSVIGNFVEIVRSQIGRHAQVKHLSYLGDAKVGDFVNVGAGTITANYDGRNKHRTVIADKAQIGSGTVLVAPVSVGRAAKTGAGAVVTRGTRIRARSVYVGVPAKELLRKKGRAG